MEMGAELMFQVIADRAEKTALIVTTNLPFSEWGQVFPNPRLCGAVLDRVTDQAHIIETGGESYRFKRSLAKRGAASGAEHSPRDTASAPPSARPQEAVQAGSAGRHRV